jgi:hypothetical protein
MERPVIRRRVRSSVVAVVVLLVLPSFGTPLAARPASDEPSAIERPGVKPNVGAVLVATGVVVALFTDRLLWLAWSFTAGLRPRSDLEYEPPPNWFRRFSRAVGGAIALLGVALVAPGVRGGGLR